MILYQFTDAEGHQSQYVTDAFVDENGENLKQFTVTEIRKEDVALIQKGVNIKIDGYNELDFINLATECGVKLERYNGNTLDKELVSIS